MTREDIIILSQKAGFKLGAGLLAFQPELERFAALVAKHEREECARIVENNNGEVDGFDSPSVYAAIKDAALKIRSRNKQ